MKCANFLYESYFERLVMKNWPVVIYDSVVRQLINEYRDPKVCFTCLMNDCSCVKTSPFLRP